MRRYSVAGTAPSRHAVVVAVELDAVPVDRSGIVQPIHYGDLDRLTADPDERWTRNYDGIRTRRDVALLQHEAERRRFAVPPRRLLYQQPDAPLAGYTPALDPAVRRLERQRQHAPADDEPGHHIERVIARAQVVRGVRAMAQHRRHVQGHVAVHEPVPRPLRHPLQ